MINLKKNDAIADAVRGIMEKELKGNQTKLDKNHNGKLDSQDFKILRGQKKASEEVEAVEEGWDEMLADVKKRSGPQPSGGSGIKQGSRYGGSKQKEKPEQEEPKEKKEETSYFKDRLIERAMLKMAAKKAFKALTGGSDEDQIKDLQRKVGVPQTGKKPEPQKEEVESLEEGKMDKMTLSGLWHKHAQHSYWSDQGYGSGTDSPRHSGHAATAIENHVRKHHGNKVADDMVSHSDHHVAYHEYAGPEDAPHHEKEMAKLKKKHGISDKDLHESAPPGFEGTVKAMKKHKDIDNPFALAWSMKNKGYKSHKKADGSDK